MTLFKFCLVAASIWSLIQFWLAPRLESRIKITRNLVGLQSAITLSVLQSVKTMSAMAVLSSLFLINLTFALNFYGGSTVDSMSNAIQSIQLWKSRVDEFSWGWGLVATAAAMFMLYKVAKNNSRKHVERLFSERYDQEFQRLKDKYSAGLWETLPPTPDMQKIENDIDQLSALLEEIDQDPNKLHEFSEQRGQIVRNLEILTQRHLALDIHRRMEMNFDPEAVLGPPPRTLRQKIATLLVSQGMLKSFSRVSRAAFIISALLLIPAIVGIHIDSLADALTKRAVDLSDMRIDTSARQAREDWERAKQTGTAGVQVQNNPADDEKSMNLLSRHFEEGMAGYARVFMPMQTSVSMREQVIRSRILNHVVTNSDGHVASVPSLAQADGLDGLSRQTMASYENGFDQPVPRTVIGQQFHAELERVRKDNGPLWAKLKGSVHEGLGYFMRASTTDDLGAFLFNNALGNAMDTGLADGPMGELVKSMHDGMRPESFQRVFNSASQRFMADLAAGKSPADATRSLADDHTFLLFKDDEIRHLKSVMETQRWGDNPRFHPPTLVARIETQVDFPRAVQATDAMRQVGVGARRQQELADPLIEYDDLFPAQHGDEAKTKRAELLKKWDPDSVHVVATNINDLPATELPSGGWGEMPSGGGGSGGGGFPGWGGGGAKPASHVGGGGMGGFARARSFSGLRGFSRIGGVLIGNEPEIAPANPADFSDISWRAGVDGIKLSLVRRHDGKLFELGPFMPDSVEKALAYAADNRKVTVTMISAPPLAELKVFVHPALIDTRTGCRAVELDRFVDIYTGQSRVRQDSSNVFLQQDGLYRYAQATRVKSIIERIRQRGLLNKEVEDELAALERRAENTLRGLEQDFGNQPVSFLSDPERSPIETEHSF